MRRMQLTFVFLGLIFGLIAQERPTFRAEVSLVHVDVQVRGKNGQALTGLTRSDFQIYDEGQEQTVIALSGEEQSVDLILLFDVSGSMRHAVEEVTGAAHSTLLQLRRGDRVSVMAFDREARVIAPFTEDHAAIEEAIARLLKIRFGGGTRIHDAVYAAAKQFIRYDQTDQRRRAVLIITDNISWPGHNESKVIENLWEADAILCGLVTSHNKSLAGLLVSKGVHVGGGIDRIVEKTGGEELRSDDITSAFPEMMHRIRSRYSLYYRLPQGMPRSLRTITVKLSPDCQSRFPEARVVARQGYRLKVRDEQGSAVR